MNSYIHSVSLDSEKCKGCTTCMKHCPTEAIRVFHQVAHINPDRCIDCGECIRVCPHNAKKANYNRLEQIKEFKWKIALPAPALFAQFDGLDDIGYVLQGLLDLGFDDVFEVSQAAEFVTSYSRQYLKTPGVCKPVISSACPAVVRLICLRFPYLKDNIMPLLPPVEVAAAMAKEKAAKEHPELKEEEIGVCFISPCPAKVSYVENGFGSYKSRIDLVVPISEVYFKLINVMNRDVKPEITTKTGVIGISWASSGGEASGLLADRVLAADGINNVIQVLEKVENGNIPSLDFIELNACTGGCVGGVLTIENPFIARNRLQTLRKYLPVSRNTHKGDYIPEERFFNEMPTYKPLSRLSDNIGESMKLLAKIQAVREDLPGIDCGACGSPNCRAFAEDLVLGKADFNDCIIGYKKLIKQYINAKGREDDPDDSGFFSGKTEP